MTPDTSKSFLPNGQRAATASWIIPLCGILLSCVLSSLNREAEDGRLVIAIIFSALFFILFTSGIVLAVTALLSMKVFGKRGIFGRALVGLILNILMLGLLMYGFALPFLGMPTDSDIAVNTKWTTYTAPNKEFSVELQGELTPLSNDAAPPGRRNPLQWTQREARSMQGQVYMYVDHIRIPYTSLTSTTDDAVDAKIQGMLNEFGAVVTSRKMTGAGYEQIDIDADITSYPGRLKLRSIFDDDTVIMLLYAASDRYWSDEDCDRFFNSSQRPEQLTP